MTNKRGGKLEIKNEMKRSSVRLVVTKKKRRESEKKWKQALLSMQKAQKERCKKYIHMQVKQNKENKEDIFYGPKIVRSQFHETETP